MPLSTTMRSNRNISYQFHILLVIIALVIIIVPSNATLRSESSSDGNSSSILDTCSQPMLLNGCTTSVTCSACLTRPGCAIESTTGNCVSIERISSSVGIEYFESGKNTYCDADDSACTSCSQDSTSSVCRGKNSCICVRQCEIQDVITYSCEHRMEIIANSRIVLPLLLIAFVICVYQYRFRKSRNALSLCRRSIAKRPKPHVENHLTMKLDGWRHYMEEHSEQFDELELKDCSRHSQETVDESYRDGDSFETSITVSPLESNMFIEAEDGCRIEGYTEVTTPRSQQQEPSKRI